MSHSVQLAQLRIAALMSECSMAMQGKLGACTPPRVCARHALVLVLMNKLLDVLHAVMQLLHTASSSTAPGAGAEAMEVQEVIAVPPAEDGAGASPAQSCTLLWNRRDSMSSFALLPYLPGCTCSKPLPARLICRYAMCSGELLFGSGPMRVKPELQYWWCRDCVAYQASPDRRHPSVLGLAVPCSAIGRQRCILLVAQSLEPIGRAI